MRQFTLRAIQAAVAAAFFYCVPTAAQEGAAPVVHLRRGDVSLQSTATLRLAGKNISIQGESQWIVKTGEDLKNTYPSIVILEAFPGGLLRVLAPGDAAFQNALQTKTIEYAVAFEPSWKIDPSIAGKTGVIPVAIAVRPGTLDAVKKEILASGGTISSNQLLPDGLIESRLPQNALLTVAMLGDVLSVGPVSERVPLNRDERGYSGVAGLEPAVSLGGKGLDGSGMTVGIGDNCPALGHVDTRDRNINFNPAAITNHATHVAGTVAGTGLVDPRGRGMAPSARIITHFFDGIWAKTPELLQGYHMTLTNNSYAAQVGTCSYVGIYDAYSAKLDALAIDIPVALHVFAAGNDGGLNCTPGEVGYRNIPGGYQPAKNNLVVGNVDKSLNIYQGSSRGPVRDGRLKPEICAFGTDVFSCKPTNIYQLATGTSMASPSVTGALTLLSQRYRQLKGTDPTNTVLKALIINGADDFGNPGPDYKYGFGMFNLVKSVNALEDNRYFSATASKATPQTYTVTVPSGMAQLKVLLVWNDPPASTAAAKALINDLDLSVTTPDGFLRKPLVLNPALPDFFATEGADTLNNIEQVLINNPATGNYTFTISTNAMATGTQPFTVAYDYVPDSIRILAPAGNNAVASGAVTNIYWQAPAGNQPFTIESTSSNGSVWSTIGTATANERSFAWTPPASTAAARVVIRVTRGTKSAVSSPFTLNPAPQIQLSAQQCPGYVVAEWQPVFGATSYQLLRKIGPDLVPVDTVTGSNYAFGGLPLSEEQWVAVRPLYNGNPGYRSNAISRTPNTGTGCGSFANGDLTIDSIRTAKTGRVATSTAFTPNQPLTISVRNLGSIASGNYTISYRIGNNPWQQTAQQASLPPNSSTTVTIASADLSATGSYSFQAAVLGSIPDPVRRNDSIAAIFRQLPNAFINVNSGFLEDFEASGRLTTMQDSAGLFSGSRWDYSRSGVLFGRLRSFVDTTISITGTGSLSLDADRNNPGAANAVEGTFNLAGTAVGTEIRVEWDYRLHGKPKRPSGNKVWVRGSDTAPWQTLAFFDSTATDGNIRNSGSLSVTDVLTAAGQALSSSTGFRISQEDTSVIAARAFGNGLTVDNFKVYSVSNDVALLRIDTPIAAACNLSAPVPLRIVIANGTRTPQASVPVFYRLDSGAVQSSLVANLGPKDTVVFTFPQLLSVSRPGLHRLDVWVAQSGDSYRRNDSILNYRFRNQGLIRPVDAIENFERGDGGWYADGKNSSWQHGTPTALRIRNAASGKNAWKTGLSGGYNDNEVSYLYSPCFDLSQMTAPQLSFSLAYEIENCGTFLCDAAWLEWSTDGTTWIKLGRAGDGYNWYDSTRYDAWTAESGVRWKVTTIGLPKTMAPLRLRFVMQSDAGSVKEGLAIDDVHIYDAAEPVVEGADAQATQNVSSAGFVNIGTGQNIILAIDPRGQSLGLVTARSFSHSSGLDSMRNRYLLPRSFAIKPQTSPVDTVLLRLYVSDDDLIRMLADSNCPGCPKAADVYRLGILKYDDPNKDAENGTMADNKAGLYRFIRPDSVAWVPYGRGYYAQIPVGGFSEFWFTDDAPDVPFLPADGAVNFSATRRDRTTVATEWVSLVDSLVDFYEVQRADRTNDSFRVLSRFTALHRPGARYYYDDIPPASVGDTLRYRLRWRQLDGSIFFSRAQQVIWSGENTITVYPNPTDNGIVRVNYTATPGAELRYELYDMMGRLLVKGTDSSARWSSQLSLNLPQVKGLTILRLQLAGKIVTEKLLFR